MSGQEKLQELVLYLSVLSEGDPRFSKTKLYKLLFNVDFRAYRELGRSITDQEYRKLPRGPVPADAAAALAELHRQKALWIRETPYFNYSQQKPLALRSADLSSFSGPEVSLIDRLVLEFWDRSAKEMSDLSHEFIGWKAVEWGAPIPYDMALVNLEEPSEEDYEYARELAAQGR